MKDKRINRRDFLDISINRTFGSLCLPSLATLLYNSRAKATGECDTGTVDSTRPAFIAVDLAGGASIAGNNVMVYDAGGKLLTSYTGLGLPPDLHPDNKAVNTDLGLAMHADSPMLAGIKEVIDNEISAKVNGCVICTQSADDTSSNELATAQGIFLAGGNGLILPLIGMRNSIPSGSGGNSVTPFITGVAPTQITSIEDARQILAAGDIWTGSPRMEKVLATIEKLSFAQLQKFAELSLPEQTHTMLKCGYTEATRLLKRGEDEADPTKDPALASMPSLNQQNPAAVAIAYLVLKGMAGSGTITLSGYDYHDLTATNGDQKDMDAGRVIGTLLRMAAMLRKKLMIHVYTDGGVYANTDAQAVRGVEKFAWQGDAEARSAAFVLVYDPDAADRPELNFQQMGAYKSDAGGTVDLSPAKHASISQNPKAQAEMMIANWLAWQGRQGEFSGLIPGGAVGRSELDEYLFMQG